MKRRCVITAGITAREPPDHPRRGRDFKRGLDLLVSGLRDVGYSGGFLSWFDCYPKGSPEHCVSPYAFKPFCFAEARTRGYEAVLWLDTSIRIKASLDPLFRIIEDQGYFICEEWHSVGQFCGDNALAPLGINREESFLLPSCRSGVLGLDLTNAIAGKFLAEWTERAMDGVTFPGPTWSGVHDRPRTASQDPRVHGHRHDQTAASVIAFKLGMTAWCSREDFNRTFDIDRTAPRGPRGLRLRWRRLIRWIRMRWERPRHVILNAGESGSARTRNGERTG